MNPEEFEKRLRPRGLGPGARRALYWGVFLLAFLVVLLGGWGLLRALMAQ